MHAHRQDGPALASTKQSISESLIVDEHDSSEVIMMGSDSKQSKPRNMEELFSSFKSKYADNESLHSDTTGSLYGGDRNPVHTISNGGERRAPAPREFVVHSNRSFQNREKAGLWTTNVTTPTTKQQERDASFSSQASSEIAAFKPKRAFRSTNSFTSTKADDEVAIEAVDRGALGHTKSMEAAPSMTYTNSLCVDDNVDDEDMPASPFKRPNAHIDGDAVAEWMKQLRQCGPCSAELSLALRCPGPRVAKVQCYVKRTKNRLKGDIFQLFVEDVANKTEHFVLAARRRIRAATPTFLVTMANNGDFLRELKKSSQNIIAVLRGNRFGTQYRMHGTPAAQAGKASEQGKEQGRSSSSSSTAAEHNDEDEDEVELAAVRFRQDGVSSVGGVRQFSAVIPDPSADRFSTKREGLLALYDKITKGDKCPDTHKISVLRSVVPQWEEKVKGYVLDFKGRVSQGSPKNCQLTTFHARDGTNGQDVLFMFGKRAKDVYVMDFAYPLGLLQAFGIAIACFDTRSFAAA